MLNTNLIHNVLNILIALTAGVTAFLLATGCVSLASGALDCGQSWIAPEWSAGIAAVMAVLKSIINIARDGFGGLWQPQPPVERKED